MGFLNPFLLAGLGFLTIPVLLLLFLHRRKMVIRWAAYEWMRRSIVQDRRRIQIEDLLKLISKLLLIAAIVLMIARPFIRREGLGDKAAVIIDNSPSMATTYDAGDRLERAKTAVQNMLDRHRGRVAVYSFSDRFDGVVSDFTDNREAISRAVAGIQNGAGAAGAETFFDELRRNATVRDARAILFVGDFQSHWYANGKQIADEYRSFGGGLPMTWHSIDTRPDVRNCAVELLRISPEGAFSGRQCFVTVRVRNGVAQEQPQRTLQLYVNGVRTQKIPLKLAPSEVRETKVSFTVDEPGWHDIVAEIDPDLLDNDNRRSAALHLEPQVKVLLIAPPAEEEGVTYDRYLQAALESLFPEQGLELMRTTPQSILADALAGVDVVFTTGLSLPADGPLAELLDEYVQQGNGLVAFLPGASGDEAGVFGAEAQAHTEQTRIDPQQLDQTYLAFMTEEDMNPQNITFERSLIFPPADELTPCLVTEAGINGVRFTRGEGRAVLFGFTPHRDFSNIVYNPNFVQMVLRVLHDTTGRRPLHQATGRFDRWPRPDLNPGGDYELVDRQDNRWDLTVEGVGDDAQLVLPAELAPDIYSLHDAGKEIARIGLNPDTEDSRLEPIRESDLQEPVDAGLKFTSGSQITAATSRLDLTILTLILLLAAVALEAYAHFLRRQH